MKLKELERMELVNEARQLYADRSNDNIEVDDNAKVSKGDDGAWVQAWVWVRARSNP